MDPESRPNDDYVRSGVTADPERKYHETFCLNIMDTLPLDANVLLITGINRAGGTVNVFGRKYRLSSSRKNGKKLILKAYK